MRIEILEEAERDLIEGFHFYENQAPGLGLYFRTNLFADIEGLKNYAGIHSKPYKRYHRLLSKKFPFAIFYRLEKRNGFHSSGSGLPKDPAWIRDRLA
jgi:hypothetical protein